MQSRLLAVVALAAMPLVSHAGVLGVQVGENYQSLSYASSGAGLGLSADYLHRDSRDDQTLSLGAGFSLPLGPVMLTAGAKLSYLDVAGRNEWAVPVGGRIGMSLGQSFGVYAQGYAASNGMASGNIHQYQDGEIGASFTPFKPLTVSAGYRYSDVELAGGSWKRKLADGPFVGAALSF